jgi:hypothetical protein
MMAVAEAQQTPDPFELVGYDGVNDPMVNQRGEEDVFPGLDVYEGGNLGLHLGVLRRFAAMAPGAASFSIGPALDR